jgi:hypothetical protein
MDELEILRIQRKANLKFDLHLCSNRLDELFYEIRTCDTKRFDFYIKEIIPIIALYRSTRKLAREVGIDILELDEKLANCNPGINYIPFKNDAIKDVRRI